MKLGPLKNLAGSTSFSPPKRVWQLILVAIWIIFLAYIIWSAWTNRQLLLPYLEDANYSRLGGMFLFYVVSLCASICGWAAIMQAFAPAVGWWKHTQIYCLTLAARRLPGTVWYVGGRMALYPRLGVTRKTVLFASTLEMVVTVVSGAITALAFALLSNMKISVPALVLLAASAVLGLVILYPGVLKVILQRVDTGLAQNMRSSSLPIWVLAYIVMWATSGLMVSQLVSIFQPLQFGETLLIIAAWSVAGTIGLLTVFLPSTFGAVELALTALLAPILPLPLAGAVAIGNRLFSLLMEALLALIFQVLVARFPFYAQLTPESNAVRPTTVNDELQDNLNASPDTPSRDQG
jgi:uncharacterized membrane protein YbhN (UPF0104 family)